MYTNKLDQTLTPLSISSTTFSETCNFSDVMLASRMMNTEDPLGLGTEVFVESLFGDRRADHSFWDL